MRYEEMIVEVSNRPNKIGFREDSDYIIDGSEWGYTHRDALTGDQVNVTFGAFLKDIFATNWQIGTKKNA